MSATLDVLNSSLASTLRLWRGTNARASARQPEKHLELYEFEACPYCRLVREALTELDLDAQIYPTPHGGKRYRPKVAAMGGKQQFPFLVDPNSGKSMYESADIIDYLYRTYAGRPAPTRLLRPLDVSLSVLASIPRFRAGSRARPSRAPKRPLELFSFESSPYSRRVRELLCELELPYLLRSTGKATSAGPRTTDPSRIPVPETARARTHTDRTSRACRQGPGALPGRSEYWQVAVRVGGDQRISVGHLRQVTHASMRAGPDLTDPRACGIS